MTFIQKARLAVGGTIVGKRTIASVVALMVVKWLEGQGIALPEGYQEALEIAIAGAIVIFMRLAIKNAAKKGEDDAFKEIADGS